MNTHNQREECPDQATNQPRSDSSESTLCAGALIDNRYEVLAHIGTGGMGEVYKVFDRQTRKIYALKMIAQHLARQKTVAKRLEHEAQAARTLVHGNIVSVYDVGQSPDGVPFLLMDYVEGEGLDDLIKKESVLTPSRVVTVFTQIAEALVHAQQKGIVHRDIKPSNILMTKTPEGTDMVKIVDFGIAKISDQDGADKTKLTQTGELLGTPLYMSPEQCRGDELDARSDIYSLGCVMYELLTGRSPFAAENQVKVILKHLSEDPQPLPNGAGISPDLKRVIMRCMEKRADDRYANAVDLHIDLERINNDKPIRAHKRKFRPTIKHKVAAAASAAGLLLFGSTFLCLQYSLQHNSTSVPLLKKPTPDSYLNKTLADWTDAIEKKPNDPKLYLGRGKLHAMRDERTNAIDDFSQAIALKPDYLDALGERSREYTLNADLRKATLDANTLIKLAPDSDESYETRGWDYLASEQYADAIADFKHAIKLNDDGYYHYQLATLFLKLALYDQAESEINTAIRMDDGREIAFMRGLAGMIATFRQDYPKAEMQLKRAIMSPDGRGVEWQELAYYYVSTGKMPDAEQAIRQAKALETFPARAMRLAGELYRTEGQYDKAIQEFSGSTSLEEYAPGIREKAVTEIQLGQWQSALLDLKKSVQLNPYSSETLSFLALVEDHLNMQPDAARHIAAAFQAKAIPPMVYKNRAAIELNDGATQKASADADKAVKADPWFKEGYEVRAQIFEKLGNKTRAQTDRGTAAKLISHLDL